MIRYMIRRDVLKTNDERGEGDMKEVKNVWNKYEKALVMLNSSIM